MKLSKSIYMGYSNGQLETSSGTGKGERGEPGLPGIGFNLTDDGNFDLDSKRLTDVADPVDLQDAVTKKYLNSEKDKVLLFDGSKSMKGNLQMGTKKIINLGDGSSPGDAVNYSQLISHTTDHKRDYQIAPSFKFYRDFGDKGELTKSSVKITGHQHLNLYDVGAIEGSNTGFGGEAWSSLKMTNTLERGTYTVVFETFSSFNSLLNDENLLQSVTGDDHLKVLTFSHDWQSSSGGNTPHSKAYIQFSSDGQSGEIKFQIRYYGSSYNQVGLDLLFFSRVLRGKNNDTFNHLLFDVIESKYGGEFLFFEDLNLSNNKIINLGSPKKDGDAITKKYLNDNALMLSGGNMKGNIDMSGNRIFSLQLPTGPQQPATKEYTEKYFFYQKQAMKPPIIMLIVKSLSISPHPLMIMTLSIKIISILIT